MAGVITDDTNDAVTAVINAVLGVLADTAAKE
jgi:hypothetical protein